MQEKRIEYISISKSNSVPCFYENGKLFVYMEGHTCEVDDELNYLITNVADNSIPPKQVYYHLVFPVKKVFSTIYIGADSIPKQSVLTNRTYSFLTDFYISN